MNDPIVKVNKSTETGFTFKLSNVNVSVANGLRRTILSGIPVIGFDKSQCTIETNTSQFINEIIKHRLTCIPIMLDHYSDDSLNMLPSQYIMELDVENTDNEERIVTTGDFILTNKETGNKVSKTDTDKIFPKNSITGDYITFLRLRPKLSETIPGQSIKLKCGFAVFTAKDDSVYIPVSKCTYFNTVDKKEAEKAWLIYKTDFSKQFDNSGDSKKEINEELKFEKKNFDALEMYRHFEKDSFDFTVKTTSFYTESQLVHKGCSLLIERLERFINNILKIDGLDDDDDDNNGTNNGTNDNKHAEPMVKIKLSHEVLEHPSSMENSFDIIMVGEDYTLGNILQHLVYDMFYIGDKSVIYCGFQKYHPHDLHSVLRVAYTKPTTTETLVDDLKKCVKRGVDIFGKIQKVIGGGK